MNNSRYLKNVVISSFILVLLFALFNYFVNPFEIFNLERVSGFNQIKPEASKRVRVFKKYQSIFAKPNVLIVGNSRVEMGLDPKHESFEQKRVYNLGVPGIWINSQLLYAQHVIESADVDEVLIAVDFADFVTTKDYIYSSPSFSINPFSDRYGALLSLDALKASIATMFKQNQFESNRLPNGFNPAKDYLPIIKFEGQEVLFKQKLEMLNGNFENKMYDQALTLESEYSGYSALLKHINTWMADDIKVYVFINPYHRDYYTTMAEHGLLAPFNRWRELMNNTFSKKIDFCDFTNLGYEKSDNKLTENELAYFWEPSHYKKELGDIMIPMILNGC